LHLTEYLSRNSEMIIAIGDIESLQRADNAYLALWPVTNGTDEYLKKRLPDNKNKIKSEIMEMLKLRARDKLKALCSPDTRWSDFVVSELENSVDFLIEIDDFEFLRSVYPMFFNQQTLKEHGASIRHLTINKYSELPKDLQEIIVKSYELHFAYLDSFDRSFVFDFLKDKSSCRKLRELKQLYASELGFTNLPDNCK